MLRNIFISLLTFCSTGFASEFDVKLIADFNKTVVKSDSNPRYFATSNNKLLFFASKSLGAKASLFSYDISTEELIKIESAPLDSNPVLLGKTDTGVLFKVRSNSLDIWFTDGTEVGTKLIYTPPYYSLGYRWIYHLGDIYFYYTAPNSKLVLMKTDGTASGTVEVYNTTYVNGKRAEIVDSFVSDGNNLYFFENNLFKYIDENFNVFELCSWEQPIHNMIANSEKIVFKGSEVIDLYECEKQSNQINNLSEELSPDFSPGSLLIKNNEAIYFNDSNNDKVYKYLDNEIVYEIDFNYSQHHPAVVIDGTLVLLSPWGIDYIESDPVTYPDNINGVIRSTPFKCLNGACFIRENNDALEELWYIDFESKEGNLLKIFNRNKLKINGNKEINGVSINNNLLAVSSWTWDAGLEPRLLNFETLEINLIEDISRSNSTASSNVSEYLIDNGYVYFMV